jgi:multidrug efflux pump
VVFLCLAALYSWSVPFAVMLVVPLRRARRALAAGAAVERLYFQVGLLATIGLSSKNAILIVDSPSRRWRKGQDLVAATLEAVRMRLR